MSNVVRPTMRASFSAACLLAVVQSGCTSALTTAYLREGLWDAPEHAATKAADAQPADDRDAAVATDGETPAAEPDPAADRERREAALEEAMTRLSRLGALDPSAEAALVATLQRTQPEDWPVVVDEFAISLSAAAPSATAAAAADDDAASVSEPAAPPAEPASAARADADVAPAADESPATVPQPEVAPPDEVAASDTAASAAAPTDPDTASDTEPAPAPPALSVRTACFASAVRAWGDVDRFAADRFRPGQEVIVYLELDELTSGSSPAGHTTCVDTVLRLVDGNGTALHTWRFEPLAETCVARRRDYFARYVVRFPESLPPGPCRVEAAVTDTLAGATAAATLPLDIVPGE